MAYFFSPFLQATRLCTTGWRHALNAFYMRFETQITVTISYRDERIIFFPILILKSEILDSFFLIPIELIQIIKEDPPKDSI